jgi:hypothetical protein
MTTTDHRTGPVGIRIYLYGKMLRGVCPNGMEIFIPSHPDVRTLAELPDEVIAMIEDEMLRTATFILQRKPANVN